LRNFDHLLGTMPQLSASVNGAAPRNILQKPAGKPER
jgi:hypothetical protein